MYLSQCMAMYPPVCGLFPLVQLQKQKHHIQKKLIFFFFNFFIPSELMNDDRQRPCEYCNTVTVPLVSSKFDLELCCDMS